MSSVTAKYLPMIDIGINLVDGMFSGVYHGHVKHPGDVESVLARAVAVGVKCLLITAGTVEESKSAIELCKKYNSDGLQCFCTVGCHPTRCNEFANEPENYFNVLRSLIFENTVRKEGGCVAAVGELGLDYDRVSFCEKDVQMTYFVKQLELAEEFQLPLFIHDRNTGDDLFTVLQRHRQRFPGGVVHSFTGTQGELNKLLSLDLYIGINGCSLKTEENLAVAGAVPLDRLMIETDGPWCEIRNTHASHRLLQRAAERGESVADSLLAQFPICRKEKFVDGSVVKSRCEPCHLIRVLEILYELHRESVENIESLAHRIYNNTRQLFPFRPCHPDE